MSSLHITDSDLSLTDQKSSAISYPLVASVVLHALMGFLVYSFLPSPLASLLTEPVKTISVVLSPALPEVKAPEPIPPKPIAKPKPKPKPVVKKKVITQETAAVAVQQKKPKPIIKPVIKPIVKPKPKVKPTSKVVPKPSTPAPAPVSQQATLAPQPTYKPKPKYPAIARRRGIEGTVIFKISLNNNGSVSNAIITQSSGSRVLDKSALKTVQTWRFPANRFNSLTSFKQSIQFRLQN